MSKGHGRSESVSALSSQRTDVSVFLTVFSRRCLVERTPDIRHCRKFLVILTSFTHVYVTEARRRVLWTFRVYLSNRSVLPPFQLRNGLKCRVSVHLWQIETCARTFISGTRMFTVSFADRNVRPLFHLRHRRKCRVSMANRNECPPFHLPKGRKFPV